MDQAFFEFTGIKAGELKKQLATGKGDQDILEWIQAVSKYKRADYDITAWSAMMEKDAPSEVDNREFFQEQHKALAPNRKDISTWFDYLDLDDFITFGGKP